MKNAYIFIFLVFSSIIISCSSDNPVNNNSGNPPQPTYQDSIVKLIYPVNGTHINAGDTLTYIWSRSYHSSYFLYEDTSAQFLMNNYTLVTDTFLTGIAIGNEPLTAYWKVEPVNQFWFGSDTNYYYYNQ